MASIEELIKEASAIKVKSDELAQMIALAGKDLSETAYAAAGIVRAAGNGGKAVDYLMIASQSLRDASDSIKTLGDICNDYVTHISQ